MSSEVQKYIETALDKKENLFNAEVIKFPNDKNINETEDSKIKAHYVWKINDKSNDDQLKAVIGVCFMFAALILMGLYSNFV